VCAQAVTLGANSGRRAGGYQARAASSASWRAKRKSLHPPSLCRPRLGRSLKDELSPIIDGPLWYTVQAQHAAGRAASTTWPKQLRRLHIRGELVCVWRRGGPSASCAKS